MYSRHINPPRNYGSHFEKSKTAFEEGGGRDEIAEPTPHNGSHESSRPDSIRVEDEKRASGDV